MKKKIKLNWVSKLKELCQEGLSNDEIVVSMLKYGNEQEIELYERFEVTNEKKTRQHNRRM